MIIQRRVDFDGDSGVTGIFWEDIPLSDGPIEQVLFELDDPVGTEYRIMYNEISTATVTQPPLPNKGIKFGDSSAQSRI